MVKKAVRKLKVLGKEVDVKKDGVVIDKVLSRGQKRRHERTERVSRKRDMASYLSKVHEEESNLKEHGVALGDFSRMATVLNDMERTTEIEIRECLLFCIFYDAPDKEAIKALERDLDLKLRNSKKAFEAVEKLAMEVYRSTLQDPQFIEDPVGHTMTWLKELMDQRASKQKELKIHLDALSARSVRVAEPAKRPAAIISSKRKIKSPIVVPKKKTGILRALKINDKSRRGNGRRSR